MRGYETSVASTSVGKSRRVLKQVSLNGIGSATQLANGEIHISYPDGSRLLVSSDSITSVTSGGKVLHHKQKDTVDPQIRSKLAELPTIIDALKCAS